MKISITLSNGNVMQKETDLEEVIIGRSPKCGFQIQDDALSRQHAKIEYKDGDFYITDLKSSNGVYLDGEKIKPKTKKLFSTYQTLLIGHLECQVVDNSTRLKPEARTRVMDLKVETDHIQVDSNLEVTKPSPAPTIPRSARPIAAPLNKKHEPPYSIIAGFIILVGVIAYLLKAL